jgi:hypothetical protein
MRAPSSSVPMSPRNSRDKQNLRSGQRTARMRGRDGWNGTGGTGSIVEGSGEVRFVFRVFVFHVDMLFVSNLGSFSFLIFRYLFLITVATSPSRLRLAGRSLSQRVGGRTFDVLGQGMVVIRVRPFFSTCFRHHHQRLFFLLTVDGWVYTNDAWLGARPALHTSTDGSVTRRERRVRRVWYVPKRASTDS